MTGWRAASARDASPPGGQGCVQIAPQSITPVRLMQMQVVLIYMNSGLWKLGGPTWRDGSTIHYVLNLNTYQRFPGTLPVALDPLLTLGTYLTLFWELTFGFMLLNRWTRRVALLFGVALHVGLWVSMELGTFSWVILASYIAFVDPQTVSNLWARLRFSSRSRQSDETQTRLAETA